MHPRAELRRIHAATHLGYKNLDSHGIHTALVTLPSILAKTFELDFGVYIFERSGV